MTTTSAIYWDPFDEVIDESPHAIWRRMRDEMPLYRNDTFDFWALSRHADVHAAHVDPQTYLSGYGTVLELMGTDKKHTAGQLRWVLPTADGVVALGEVARALSAADLGVDDLGLRQPTLDEVFLLITGNAPNPDHISVGEPISKEDRR